MKCNYGLVVALLLLNSTRSIAQSGTNDGPITRRTYDAVFVRDHIRDHANDARVTTEIQKLPNGDRLLKFLQAPSDFISPSMILPTVGELTAMRRIVEGDSVAGLVAAGYSFASGAFGAPGFQSAIFFGLTDFVVGRAKAELVDAALRQSQGWFLRYNNVLPVMFPATNVLLNAKGDISGDWAALLRSSVRKDLQVLPTAVWKVSRDVCLADTVARCKDGTRRAAIDGLRMTASLTETFVRRESPVVAFSKLSELHDQEFLSQGGRVTSRSLSVLAGEIAPGGGRRFVLAFESPNSSDFALAFLSHAVLRGTDSTLSAKLSSHTRELAEAARTIESVRADYDALREAQTASLEVRRERFASLAEGLLSASAVLAGQIAKLPTDSTGVTFARTFQSTAEVATDILAGDYVSAVARTFAANSSLNLNVPANAVRWISFSAELGSAKSSEDVRSALERFALPPASYITKRYPADSAPGRGIGIYINSYLGVSGGVESLGGTNKASKTRGFAGFSLPIGLEVSDPRGQRSLLLSVLDLGALASYRIGGDSVQAAPNVALSNVIAPGLFVTYSFSRSFPVAIGAGWQYAPRLRTVGKDEPRDASRFGLFVATDVPLFRIR